MQYSPFRPSVNMRVLFVGMPCATSSIVLDTLLAACIDICGVLMPAGLWMRANAPAPIVQLHPPLLDLQAGIGEPGLAQRAWARNLPVFELRRADAPETLASLAALRPDVACVACFPLRLPPALFALPPHGTLNVHPSLLPAHRGPAPLFWAFRAGEGSTGVTIHQIDAEMDTGPIVRQARFALPDGMSGAAAEAGTADLGAELLLGALRDLMVGSLSPHPQPPGGSYESWPGEDDWRIGAEWSARRAFKFMRGTAEWGEPYRLRAGGTELLLAQALSCDPEGELGAPFVVEGELVRVQLAPGVLVARLAAQPQPA